MQTVTAGQMTSGSRSFSNLAKTIFRNIPADDLIISQLQAIFQLFLSYLSSGEYYEMAN